MRRFPQLLIGALVLCLAPALALAQAAACPAIVETALAAAEQACAETGRNEACYGNLSLTAQPQPGVSAFTFEQVGDIVAVAALQSMQVNPLDEQTGEWGVALMKLQANLPDTLPGQNVTFLLFGDVEIAPAEAPGAPPFSAFYLRTGIGDAACNEAPESGLLVQTPAGVGEVAFTVNGVDVQMGSTVFFQADAAEGMTISTLEGHAYARAEGREQVIVPGTWIRVALERAADAGPLPRFRPAAAPELPQAYAERTRMLNRLPFRLLERRIEAAPPLEGARLERLLERIRAGGPLCGQDPLPPCKDRTNPGAPLPCIPRPPLGERLPPGERRPFCPETPAPPRPDTGAAPTAEPSPDDNLGSAPPDDTNDNADDRADDDDNRDDGSNDGDDDDKGDDTDSRDL